MKAKTFILGCSLLFLASCGGGGEASSSSSSAERPEGWNYDIKEVNGDSGIGYEIFVQSFADSNGDGKGDLKGIENKLDYLSSLGVQYLWLTPIHPSSTYHHYDVIDYYEVSSDFGTVEDFVSLSAKAKEKGMEIVLDMVFNHASTSSSYFYEAAADYANGNTSEDSKADWFMFFDELPSNPEEGRNFKSISREGKDFFYECDFDSAMADWNLSSESVYALQSDIMKFWFEKGASGFRFDGASFWFKGDYRANLNYCEKLSNAARSVKEDAYLIAEYWEGGTDRSIIAGFGDKGMKAFNFVTSIDYTPTSILHNLAVYKSSGSAFTKQITLLQSALNKKENVEEPVFFLSNHDQDRAYNYTSLLTKDREYKYRLGVSGYMLAPGTPFMYYGEEILTTGLRGGASTDANRRLAFNWGSGDEANCKDPVGSTYPSSSKTLHEANVDLKSTYSTIAHYRKLAQIRKEYPFIRYGVYTASGNDDMPGFEIEYQGNKYYVYHNTLAETSTLEVASNLKILDQVKTVGLESTIEGSSLSIAPYSSVVLGAQ